MSISRSHANDIMRILENISNRSGRWCDEAFSDLVLASVNALLMEPHHAQALLVTGEMAKDDDQTASVFKAIHAKYKSSGMKSFSQCLAILREASVADLDYHDLLGEVYMLIRSNGKGRVLGQYFTPNPIAVAMAMMTTQDIESIIAVRLQEAGVAAGLDAIQCNNLMNGFTNQISYKDWEILAKLASKYFKPVRVNDPCCGSGVMLMAMAKSCPRWAIETGCVVFYANDLDLICARMCLLNMLLHGLTGVVTQGDTLLLEPPDIIGWSPAEWHQQNTNRSPTPGSASTTSPTSIEAA